MHAKGVTVSHRAKASCDGRVDAAAHGIRLAHGEQQSIGFLDRRGMAAEKDAQVSLDRARQCRVPGRAGEQRKRQVDWEISRRVAAAASS